MKVSKIVDSALKQLGVLAIGETAGGDEATDAIECLQDLLAQWSTHRLYVHKAQILELQLTKGAGTYRIGKIEGECCEYEITCCGEVLDRPDLKAEIASVSNRAWLDDEEITLVRDLNDTGINVKAWYQVDHPNWLFHVKENAKVLKIKTFVMPFELCLHDELNLPKQYERALKLSLALELAPMFGTEPNLLMIQNQQNAISMLKRSNSVPAFAKSDIPVGVGYGRNCY